MPLLGVYGLLVQNRFDKDKWTRGDLAIFAANVFYIAAFFYQIIKGIEEMFAFHGIDFTWWPF